MPSFSHCLRIFGLDFRRSFHATRGIGRYLKDLREVEVLDIRPQPHAIHNIVFHQLDLMAELPEVWIECTDSLSCLHTIEHFVYLDDSEVMHEDSDWRNADVEHNFGCNTGLGIVAARKKAE